MAAKEETKKDFTDKIPELRTAFKEKFKENIEKNAYHAKDLDRLESDENFAHAYLLSKDGDIAQAVDKVDVSLKFRKEFDLNELTEQSFPLEMHECGAIFYAAKDKSGTMLFNLQISKMKNMPKDWHQRKQFIGWWLDKHFLTRASCLDKFVVLIDMTNVGLRDVDLDSMKFLMNCFTQYYPSVNQYMIIYEMPWLLNTMWKVIKMMLTEAEREYVKMLGKKEVPQYIDEENLWPHMGGKNSYEYKYEQGGTNGFPGQAN